MPAAAKAFSNTSSRRTPGRPGDCHTTFCVVPAKAGTHNHRPRQLRESRRTASLKTSDTASRRAQALTRGSRRTPGRPGDCHTTFCVVPAKAGTHNHRPRQLRESRRTASFEISDAASRRAQALARGSLLSPGRPGDCHITFCVVPAKAGTHNHRPRQLRESRRTASLKTNDTASRRAQVFTRGSRRTPGRLGHCQTTFCVVPAKAGTHNHKPRRSRESRRTASFETSDTASRRAQALTRGSLLSQGRRLENSQAAAGNRPSVE